MDDAEPDMGVSFYESAEREHRRKDHQNRSTQGTLNSVFTPQGTEITGLAHPPQAFTQISVPGRYPDSQTHHPVGYDI